MVKLLCGLGLANEDQLTKPVENILAEPTFVDLMALHTIIVMRIAPFLFEPAFAVLVEARFISLCAFALALGITTTRSIDNRVPVSRLVTIVNAHHGVTEVTRDALEVIVKCQVVDRSPSKVTLVQMPGEGLVLGLLELLRDGVPTRATAIRHLQNSTRSALSTVNVVTLAVLARLGTDHADGMLLFAIRVGAIHQLPGRAIRLVQADLDLLRSSNNHESESSILNLSAFSGLSGTVLRIHTSGSSSELPLASPVSQVSSTERLKSGSSAFSGGFSKRYSKGTGRNNDSPLAGVQQKAR